MVPSTTTFRQVVTVYSQLICRERLIHLLALRPFKKVELHDRITKGLYRSLSRVGLDFLIVGFRGCAREERDNVDIETDIIHEG
jgi:hypothetical protein